MPYRLRNRGPTTAAIVKGRLKCLAPFLLCEGGTVMRTAARTTWEVNLTKDAQMDKRDDRAGLNRREFLATAAATVGAAAASSVPRASANPQLRPPAKVRLGKQVLVPGDISFAGWFRLPPIDTYPGCANDFMFAQGACASRLVNGTRRLLVGGSVGDFPLVEVSDPGTYSRTMTTATPMAKLVRVWGDCYQGKRLCQEGAPSYVHGYFWDGEKLWWRSQATPMAGRITTIRLWLARFSTTMTIR